MKLRSFIFAALAAVLLVVSACGGSPTAPPPPPPGPGGPIVEPPPVVPPTWDATKTKIMAFGDSLTEDDLDPVLFRGAHDPSGPGGAGSYPFKLHAILTGIYTSQTFNVYNLGFGGEKAGNSGTRERLVAGLNTYAPQVLLLMHGTNDLLGGGSQNATVAAVEEMVLLAQQRGIVVFVASLPPQTPFNAVKGTPNVPEEIPGYNAKLQTMAANRGAFFVDINPYITMAMLEPDGLHLLEAGNKRMAEVFYEALKAKYHKDPQ